MKPAYINTVKKNKVNKSSFICNEGGGILRGLSGFGRLSFWLRAA
jgi:hypothetical protein